MDANRTTGTNVQNCFVTGSKALTVHEYEGRTIVKQGTSTSSSRVAQPWYTINPLAFPRCTRT